jgi:hypothetical protein
MGIPLPALQIQPPAQQNLLEEYSRVMGIKGMQLGQQLQGLQLQQLQEEHADDQKWRSAMAEMANHPDWTNEDFLQAGLKAGAGPRSYGNMSAMLLQHEQGLASLGEQQLKVFKTVTDKTQGYLQDIYDAPLDEKLQAQQHAKAQAIDAIQNTKGLDPRIRQSMLQNIAALPDDTYIGDDALALAMGEHNLHDTITTRALETAKTAEASGKGAEAQAAAGLSGAKLPGAQAESTIQTQNAAIGPQGRALAGNLPFAAATGVPGAMKALALETEQKRQAAIAQVQAQAAMYAGNSALAKVPPHLVPAATSEATKLATQFADAKSASDNMSAFLSLAKSGNKAASVNVPLQGALEITTAQGVHRINRTEVEQYGSAGSLFDRISGRIHGVLSGKQIPDDVLNDMQELQNVIAGTAETKYKNGLKAVNQNYGAGFTPVQMDTAARPGNRPPLSSFEKK